MPTYQKADSSVHQLAEQTIKKFEDHSPLDAADVKIDFVFAFGDVDDNGMKINDAIVKNGVTALGLTRIIPLKDRVMGRGDVEVMFDGDHWKAVGEEEQAALMDHELHHIAVKTDRAGNVQHDDLGRPLIRLRKHDIEVGWFSLVASRHGQFSVERKQAKAIMDSKGQFYWGDFAPKLGSGTIEIVTGGKSTGPLPIGAFAKAAATKLNP